MSRGRPPAPIELTDAEREELEQRASQRMAPFCEVQRARALLLAADGYRNTDIAGRVGLDSRTICVLRQEFLKRRLKVLSDRKRTGRPRRFPPLSQSCGGPPGLPTSR